jgi:hypothetical protein
MQMNVESYRRRGALERKQRTLPKPAGKIQKLVSS